MCRVSLITDASVKVPGSVYLAEIIFILISNVSCKTDDKN